jgi:tetratricopeptide (TPR) repeat protein
MGFDKSKVMRAAEKSLAQGKIPAAIKEYQQIVKHDPDDFSALNMLGDLLIRTGQEEDAVACFTRVADHYREEGFALKAIAMYKKMDRLKPGSIEIAARLAPLYEMQGLMTDARNQYLHIADAYTRGGHAGKALEVLRKIADLDPNNTEIRLKLAAGYERENFRTDAAEAFVHAGAQFCGRGEFDSALDAYDHALKLIPHDRAALSGLTSTHIALGTADEVAELLERAVEVQPEDAELLSLLSHAYVAAEDGDAAERATAALIEQEPSSYRRVVDVIRLHLKSGNLDAAIRLLTASAEKMLSGNEDATVGELLNETLARDPEQMVALGLLVRLYTWQHDGDKLRGALERLAEAAETAGLEDDERRALTQLVRLAPDHERYRERLEELGGTIEEPESVEGLSFDATDEDVPTFESFVSITDEAVVVPAAETDQFDWNPAPSTPSSASADPSASFADLSDGTPDAHLVGVDSSTPVNFQEFDFSETPSSHGAADTEGRPATPGPAPERRDAALKQELESVDFYVAQGYTDIAFNTLEMLERQFGSHSEIDERRTKLRDLTPAAASPSSTPAETIAFTDSSTRDARAASPEELKTPVSVATPPPAPPRPSIDPGLAAIFDEFRTAVEEEDAQVDGDYETHYNLGLAYKEMDLLDEAVEEFQVAASLVAPRDGTPRYLQCCNLLGHCFMQKKMGRLAVMWFNRGLDAPGHSEDEYQALRFELGGAYEQIGDLDKAIDVFTEVYGVNVSYRGVAEKLRGLQSLKATK